MNLAPKIILVSAVLLLTACSSIEPWVKPYERANLADPIMSFGRDPVSIDSRAVCRPS